MYSDRGDDGTKILFGNTIYTTTQILLLIRSLWLRLLRGLPRTIGCYRCYVHGHGTTPYLWFTINFFVAYQRISDDEDRMILRWSVFVLPAPTVDGSTLPKLIGRWCPLSISPCDGFDGIVKPSASLSVNNHT